MLAGLSNADQFDAKVISHFSCLPIDVWEGAFQVICCDLNVGASYHFIYCQLISTARKNNEWVKIIQSLLPKVRIFSF